MTRAWVVVDLGYGDAGKGTIVDYLVRRHGARTVVRYSGGPQASHAVVTDDGRAHAFQQFGSGSFVPGVATFLSRHMLVNPLNMMVEAAALEQIGVPDLFARTFVSRDALVVTPFHRAANRLKELTRAHRHGSCGMGVGEAVELTLRFHDASLRVRDLSDLGATVARLRRQREIYRDHLRKPLLVLGEQLPPDDLAVMRRPDAVDRITVGYQDFLRTGVTLVDDEMLLTTLLQGAAPPLVFEGAQGVLLDETHGFPPYHTWSDVTARHAWRLLDRAGDVAGAVSTIGVIRAFMTRHGPGPFVTETADLEHASDPHNPSNDWQGTMRIGWPDPLAWRYALKATGGVDALAVTHLDVWARQRWPMIATRYRIAGGADWPSSVMEDIPFEATPTLDTQATLTTTLTLARPEYEAVTADPDAHVRRIEKDLGVPVWITSHGPTAADKADRGAF
jgi:adenylosuccinate synthase